MKEKSRLNSLKGFVHFKAFIPLETENIFHSIASFIKAKSKAFYYIAAVGI
jgi:hypothetical protein